MKFSHPDLQALIKGAIPLRSRRDPAGAQSKRVSVDDLVKRRADAGDLCTFDSREGSFEIVVDGVTFLASQLWVFPKYDLQLAVDYAEDITAALELTIGSLAKKRTILSPEGDYSYRRH